MIRWYCCRMLHTHMIHRHPICSSWTVGPFLRDPSYPCSCSCPQRNPHSQCPNQCCLMTFTTHLATDQEFCSFSYCTEWGYPMSSTTPDCLQCTTHTPQGLLRWLLRWNGCPSGMSYRVAVYLANTSVCVCVCVRTCMCIDTWAWSTWGLVAFHMLHCSASVGVQRFGKSSEKGSLKITWYAPLKLPYDPAPGPLGIPPAYTTVSAPMPYCARLSPTCYPLSPAHAFHHRAA